VFLCALTVVCASRIQSAVFLTQRFKRTADNNVLIGRQKRSDDSDIAAILCVAKCADDMKTQMADVTGVDFDTVENGKNDDMFDDPAVFSKLCDVYKQSKKCILGCKAGDLQEDVNRGMTSLEFMCVTHYKEFIKNTPCYNSSKTEINSKCDAKCGGENFLNKLSEEVDAETQKEVPNVGVMLKAIGDMCGYLNCQLDCGKSIYKSVCHSEEPAKLMDQFASMGIKDATSLFDKMGLSQLTPKECKQVVDRNPKY